MKMICSEELISMVFSRPELWDHTHMHYTSKKLKLKAWSSISEKLNVTVDVAKARWTNLRDLFRRELKKTLKMSEETGDPNAYKPRWKHFKAMLFLKDQIVKAEDANSLAIEDSYSLYPQTILEDGDGMKFEDDAFVELDSSPESTPTRHDGRMINFQQPSRKRNHDNTEEQYLQSFTNSSKRYQWDAASGSGSNPMVSSLEGVDEDYHFIMSILPSIRRIRQEKKSSFKLKVLQLIVEEETNSNLT